LSGNVPSVTAPFSGFGIGLLDATHISGGAAPTGNRISGNTVSGSPVAVLYDGSGSQNVIRGNHTD
jgi:parallel beta-helix repeat protein